MTAAHWMWRCTASMPRPPLPREAAWMAFSCGMCGNKWQLNAANCLPRATALHHSGPQEVQPANCSFCDSRSLYTLEITQRHTRQSLRQKESKHTYTHTHNFLLFIQFAIIYEDNVIYLFSALLIADQFPFKWFVHFAEIVKLFQRFS